MLLFTITNSCNSFYICSEFLGNLIIFTAYKLFEISLKIRYSFGIISQNNLLVVLQYLNCNEDVLSQLFNFVL